MGREESLHAKSYEYGWIIMHQQRDLTISQNIYIVTCVDEVTTVAAERTSYRSNLGYFYLMNSPHHYKPHSVFMQGQAFVKELDRVLGIADEAQRSKTLKQFQEWDANVHGAIQVFTDEEGQTLRNCSSFPGSKKY